MDKTDQIRYSRRADANLIAEQIRAREIRINRDYMGIVAASIHAETIANNWLRSQYEQIENELPN